MGATHATSTIMPVLLKICGLSDEETLDAAIAAGADFVGLVHFSKSPRHVSGERGADLADHARGRAGVVLLTVDAGAARLDELVAAMRPDVLQLHGRETPDEVAALRARHGLPVWKAIAVSGAADLQSAAPYRGVADRLLFDAKPPAGADRPGGNGTAFDWRLLATDGAGVHYVLSGGLNPGNVAQAIATARPGIVDVSSGVESSPGIKDARLMEEFAAAVRQASALPVRRAS